MKKISFLSLAALLAAALTFNACKKEDKEKNDDASMLYDNSVSESSYNDAGHISDEAVLTNSLSTYGRLGDGDKVFLVCASVAIDTVDPAIPKYKATINFGSTDCLCKDGNYRRGEIIVTWSRQYRDSGSTHTITFNNFYQNFNKVEGYKTVTNTGRNASGNLTFTTDIDGSVTIDPQYSYNGTGGTITYKSNRNIEWVQGESTPGWLDDIYLISGTASGTTTKGYSYTMNTTTPLKKEIGFPHFTAGVLNITPGSLSTRTIDYYYINGNRDNLALATVNGKTFTIKLGRKI